MTGSGERNALFEIGLPHCFREHDRVLRGCDHREPAALFPFESRIESRFEPLWRRHRVGLGSRPCGSELGFTQRIPPLPRSESQRLRDVIERFLVDVVYL
jgi:hypothetical protein